MGLTGWIIASYTLYSLYSQRVLETKSELVELAKSQAIIIEEVSRYDVLHSGQGSKKLGLQATLSQFDEAYKKYIPQHKSIEIVLGRLEAGQINILLNSGGTSRGPFKPEVLAAEGQLPIQQAVAGKSGVIEAIDYRGDRVLAAFEPIGLHRLGIVVKIDKKEIQGPFLRTASQVIALTALIVALFSFLFLRLMNPLIQRLQSKAHQLALMGEVFNFASEAIVVTDENNQIIDANPAYTEITGFQREDVLGLDPNVNASGKHDEAFYQQMWEQLDEQGFWEGEIWDRKKTGEIYPKFLKITKFLSKEHSNEKLKYLAIFSDISRAKKAEDQLKKMAYFDPLTGLANRALCLSELSTRMKLATRENKGMAVMFVDLDGFKAINDSFGHKAGDKVLCGVANRLQGRVRESDLVARLGGDEFLILLSNLEHPSEAIPVAKHLLEAFVSPFESIADHPIFLNCSIGIGFFPNDGNKPEDLIRFADTAMYAAKQKGKGQFVFYSNQLEQAAIQLLSLDYKLHRAVKNKEFEVFYQPQVHSRSGHVVGVEALVRWNDPDTGMVPPVQFIPLAEETGLIKPIGQFVLEESCRQLVTWQQDGLDPLVVSVNCSLKQFEDQKLVPLVQSILDETGLEGKWLKIEITESMMTDDRFHVADQLKELRSLGIGISMDDFGTGYSNLGLLKRLPLTDLKIDRAFIQDIVADRLIAQVVIDLAQNMDLKVVAEGAEQWIQTLTLDKMGCNVIQGFFYARPLSAPMCKDFIIRSGQDNLVIDPAISFGEFI